ncbi:MAG: DnaJ domain-containing protein [Clostridia bacterium]|jgi:DnaJ-class molecular chaperone|nr:DnaJ domain-containing protein [Clostridia bacterium]
MKEFYELLGLTETATDEEITARYNQLRDKYREDRWLDGEAGNEAAKMLTKLETAYNEIMSARKERSQNTEGKDAFEEVAELLRQDKIAEAQTKLDNFNERSAEWHYMQAVVYYKKNWTNDSKKQLEIAIQMDPDNVKYRSAYGKMNAKKDYQQQSANQNTQSQNPYTHEADDEQMGGGSVCSDCLSCCYTTLCINCLFNCCCGCR